MASTEILTNQTTGLLAYIECDEITGGTTLADLSGNSKNFTIAGTGGNPTIANDATYGNYLAFDATKSQYAYINESIFGTVTGQFAVLACVKGADQVGKYIVGFGTSIAPSAPNFYNPILQPIGTRYAGGTAGQGGIWLRPDSGTWVAQQSYGTTTLPLDNNFHVILTNRTDTHCEVWVDGVLVINQLLALTGQSAVDRTAIGALLNNAGASGFFTGGVKRVAFWSTARSAGQASSLYAEIAAKAAFISDVKVLTGGCIIMGTAKDVSGNPITVTAGVGKASIKKNGGSSITLYTGIVGSPAYSGGGGLNDMTSGGLYQDNGAVTFTVTIDSTGTPDTFKWQRGSEALTTGVAITGEDQTLSDGVTVKFAATTGHTADKSWTIACSSQSTQAVGVTIRDSIVKFMVPVGNRVEAGDTVTITIPAGMFVATGGVSDAVSDGEVTNSTGIEWLPTVPRAGRRIPVILNVPKLYYDCDKRVMLDMASAGGRYYDDTTGGPYSGAISATTGIPINSSAHTIRAFNRSGWHSYPAAADYTVFWSDDRNDAGDLNITSNGTVRGTDAPRWDAARGMWYRQYTGQYSWWKTVADSTHLVKVIALMDSDIAAYDAGSRVHPDTINRYLGHPLRMMDAQVTNNSNVVDATDLIGDAWQFQGCPEVFKGGTVSAIVAEADSFFSGGTTIKVTTAAPHGFKDGNFVSFAGTATIGGVNMTSFNYTVHVIDATNFYTNFAGAADGAVSFTSGTMACTVNGFNPAFLGRLGTACSTTRLRIHMPHGSTVACQKAIAAGVRSTYAGIIEFVMTNERWNTGFQGQNQYAMGRAAALGLSGNAQWLCYETKAMKANVIAEIGSSNVEFGLECWGSFELTDGAVMKAWCDANDFTPDFISIAHYYHPTNNNTIFTTYSTDDLIDLCALKSPYGKLYLDLAASWGVPLRAYEGGFDDPWPPSTITTAQKNAQRYFAYHPRHANLIWYIYNVLQTAGWDALNQFTIDGYVNEVYGNWSALRYWNEVAGPGDGSDDGHNNLDDLGADTNESTRSYAINKWASSEGQVTVSAGTSRYMDLMTMGM